jgi:O-antigen ligase
MPPLAAAGDDPASGSRVLRLAAFVWGYCAFFPVGVMYLNLALMLLALAFQPDLARRMTQLRRSVVFWPILLVLAWTIFAAVLGPWLPDTVTRLFHAARVALVLCMGLLLAPSEARAGLAGFLAGAAVAALVVAVHHVWGLPNWAIWSSLLASRNNFSSGNMITMATASGVCFFLGLGGRLGRSDGRLALALALALALTVAFHAVSRNSQLLLAVLLLGAVFCSFRSQRAVLVGVLAVLAVAASLWHFSKTIHTRFSELADDLQSAAMGVSYASSGGVRWRMYQEAVQGMLDHPLFGTGVGSWLPHWRSVWLGLAVDLPADIRLQFSEINNPHNDFLLAGMETGVLGLVLLAWLLVRFIRHGWLQHSAAGGTTAILGISLFATALVNAPFRDAALGMTLLWLLGVSMAAHRRAVHA